MQKSNAPSAFTIPFGNDPTGRNPIPVASQITITPGAASFTDGFPPVTRIPLASGGVPPYGKDMNGIIYLATQAIQWAQAGFRYAYDSTFSTAIGGYPVGALLLRADGLGGWLSTTDNNTTNPDATGSAGWLAVRANAGRSTIATTGGSTTPDPSVLGAPLLVISGALTSNATIVLPLTAGASWKVFNATTGSYTVTLIGATGSGVTVAQGSLAEISTDGTNYYTTTLTGNYLPIDGTAVAATKLATARTIAMTGDVTWSVSFDGSANASAAGAIANNAVTLAKLATINANSLLGNPTNATGAVTTIPLTSGIQFSSGSLGLGNITPTSVASSGIIAVFAGSTGAQQILYRGGWSNGVARWAQVIEADATYSFYSYNSSGAAIANTLRMGQNGDMVLSGTVHATSLMSGPNATSGYPLDIDTAVGRVLVRNSGSGSPNLDAVNAVNSAYVTMNTTSPWTFQNNSTGAVYIANGGNFRLGSTSGNSKYLRTNPSTAALEFVNNAYNSVIAWISDDGTWNSLAGANFFASDENLKYAIDRTAVERPLHRAAPWATYKWRRDDQAGFGPIAQDVQKIAPEYVRTETDIDGKSFLMLDKPAVTMEIAYWAARGVDRLEARLAALEQLVAGRN